VDNNVIDVMMYYTQYSLCKIYTQWWLLACVSWWIHGVFLGCARVMDLWGFSGCVHQSWVHGVFFWVCTCQWWFCEVFLGMCVSAMVSWIFSWVCVSDGFMEFFLVDCKGLGNCYCYVEVLVVSIDLMMKWSCGTNLMSREGERWEERPSVWSSIFHRFKCFRIILSGLHGKVLLYITLILQSSSCSIALSWVPTPPIFNPTLSCLHHLCALTASWPTHLVIVSHALVLATNFWDFVYHLVFCLWTSEACFWLHTRTGVSRDGDGSCVLDAFLSSFGALRLPFMVAL